MSSNQFSGTEIESLRGELESADTHHPGGHVVTVLREDLRALTPPPDAAVREAVNERELCDAEQRVQQNPLSLLARMDLEQELRIALASLRVAQAPRLTGEQAEAVRIAETLLTDTMSDYGDCEHDVGHCICKYHSGVFNLRAAFPDLFTGEVGRG